MAALTAFISAHMGFIMAIIICLVIFPIRDSHAQNLKSLISLSHDLTGKLNISYGGHHVNIIEVGGDESHKSIQLCYLPFLASFSFDGNPRIGWGSPGLAAILLALEHLNTGNGTIVPELDGINERCPLRFYTDSFDAKVVDKAASVDHIIQLTSYKGRQRRKELIPCSIISATSSSVSIPTSIISSLRGFPQISGLATSAELDNKQHYKLFGRTIPNDEGTAIPLLAKLAHWNVSHIGILHMSNEYGNAFADGIRVAAQKQAPNLQIAAVNINTDPDDSLIANAIAQLKETQFRFFFAIIPQALGNRVMMEAYKQKIAGTGLHNWLFSDTFGTTVTSQSFLPGSPLERAYRGTGILQATGGENGIPSYDKLARSLQRLRSSKEDMMFLNDRLPKGDVNSKPLNYSEITSQDSFLSILGSIPPFLYDAAVGIGLAACNLTSTSKHKEYFTGEDLFEAFSRGVFQGSSGSVVLDPETGTRNAKSAIYSLTNYINDEGAEPALVQFKGVESDLFISGEWESHTKSNQRPPFHFNDGTTAIPIDIPALHTDPSHLSTPIQVSGMVLGGILVCLSLVFATWTFLNQEVQVVRASQPIFLLIISSGTLIMGASIFPRAVNLGGADTKRADAATCMAFPSLLVVGFSLTFSALFTKTYRINQIMKSAARLQRITLTARDVMKPMVVILFLNIIVLISWSLVDPLYSKTIVVNRDVFHREIETYSFCSSSHASIFIGILGCINFGSLSITFVQAYLARNIPTEYAESRYIFYVLSVFLYVLVLGIPILILTKGNVDARFFVVSALIFALTSSIQVLIFVPKIMASPGKRTARNALP